MQLFTVYAVMAVVASANSYIEFNIREDNNPKTAFVRSQEWSTLIPKNDDKTAIKIPMNNSMMIKKKGFDGPEYAWKPWVRGGAISYTVDLSNMRCGCVAGAYAV